MKTEQELFDEIGNVLHAHEDVYAPGAWEEFVKTKKRRRGFVYLRWVTAAAILLIIGYATWLFMPVQRIDSNQPQTKNTPKSPYIYPKKTTGTDSLISDQAIAFRKKPEQPLSSSDPVQVKQHGVKEAKTPADNYAEMPALNKPEVVDQSINSQNVAATLPVNVKQETKAANQKPVVKETEPSSVIATELRKYDRGTQRLSYDSLANLKKPKPAGEQKKNSSLSYGVILSPSVGNQKMNFGTGVEVAYNISKNFALSSGITYAYINAGANRNGVPPEGKQSNLQGYNATFASPELASSFATSSTRTVQSVQMALSGVELPLSFQYKTNNGFYVSAGVSAMSVIRNSISYNYLDSRTVSTPSSRGQAPTISVITENTTQQSTETVNGFIGFYTLSAGKKVDFGKGKLNVAPFIKLPFNRVSSENLQLMHGGIQLGFGF